MRNHCRPRFDRGSRAGLAEGITRRFGYRVGGLPFASPPYALLCDRPLTLRRPDRGDHLDLHR